MGVGDTAWGSAYLIKQTFGRALAVLDPIAAIDTVGSWARVVAKFRNGAGNYCGRTVRSRVDVTCANLTNRIEKLRSTAAISFPADFHKYNSTLGLC